MKYVLSILVILYLMSCAPVHSRIAICPGKKATEECLQSYLPKGSKIISVKKLFEANMYEVEYK
jgi:hypothetical protein